MAAALKPLRALTLTPPPLVFLSAQEVEKVLPEAVTADENGMLLVNYETLTVFLIEAVKEQRKEIQRIQQILEKHGLNE